MQCGVYSSVPRLTALPDGELASLYILIAVGDPDTERGGVQARAGLQWSYDKL